MCKYISLLFGALSLLVSSSPESLAPPGEHHGFVLLWDILDVHFEHSITKEFQWERVQFEDLPCGHGPKIIRRVLG
jgi:hypothetical protein